MALGPAVQDGLGIVADVEGDVVAVAGSQLAALVKRIRWKAEKQLQTLFINSVIDAIQSGLKGKTQTLNKTIKM